MNSDQIKGKLEQAIGHVKQGVGEAFGDNKTANEGLGDQIKGSAQETWGNAKDAAQTEAAVDHAAATDHAADTRQTISAKIADVKDSVNAHIDEYKATHSK